LDAVFYGIKKESSSFAEDEAQNNRLSSIFEGGAIAEKKVFHETKKNKRRM
jgi:hypothetical protein